MKGNGRSSPKRLVDYVCLVGSRHVASDPPQSGYEEAELLRRFPPDDHPDFPLPSNIANFCQPEGHFRITTTLPTSVSSDIPDNVIAAEAGAAPASDPIVNFSTSTISPSEVTTFVFTLTDKDSNVTRFAVCHNFYRHLKSSRSTSKTSSRQRNNGYRPINNDNGAASDEDDEDNGDTKAKNFGSSSGSGRRSNQKTAVKHYSLTSICIISHFQFFSNFKECTLALKRLVTVCSQLNHPTSIDHRRLHTEFGAWDILLHLNLKPSPTLSPQHRFSNGKKSST